MILLSTCLNICCWFSKDIWMLFRTVSLGRFFWVPTKKVLIEKLCYTFLIKCLSTGSLAEVSVSLFDLIQQFCRIFLCWPTIKHRLMLLSQEHNTLTPMRLEPAILQSRGMHSTTEPLRIHKFPVRMCRCLNLSCTYMQKTVWRFPLHI